MPPVRYDEDSTAIPDRGIAGSLGFDAAASLFEGGITRLEAAMARQAQRDGRSIRIPTQTIIGAAGTVTADATGPAGGLAWSVRRITLGAAYGAPASIATPGTFIVYVDQEEVVRTVTVPNAIFFSRTQLFLRYPSKLSYAWIAGTVGVPLIVSASAIEEPTSRDQAI